MQQTPRQSIQFKFLLSVALSTILFFGLVINLTAVASSANLPPAQTSDKTITIPNELGLNTLLAETLASETSNNTNSFFGVDTYPEYFFENISYPAAWGDMDQDGDMDVVLQGKYGSLLVYLNNGRDSTGHLSFTVGAQFPADISRRHIALGDLDNDDDLDIVLVGLNSQLPTIYQNPGVNQNGEFNTAAWPTITLPIAGSSESLAYHVDLGDMNGDGKLDIAIANVGPHNNGLGANEGLANQVFQNISTGSTISLTEISITTLISVSVKASWVDIDGDNKLDLTFLDGHGDGVGSLSDALEVCHNTTTNANAPEFDCQEVTLQTGGFYFGVIKWGYLNNNTTPDLVTGNYNEVNVYYDVNINDTTLIPDIALNNSSGQYIFQVSSIEFGDVDSDGDLDILVSQGGQDAIYQNNGGTIDPTTPVWQAAFPASSTKGFFVDVDNDGDLDLSSAGGSNSMIFTNLGRAYAPTPNLTTTLTTPPAPTAFGLAWGDIDNDGDLDLATGNAWMCNGQPCNANARPTDPNWAPSPNTVYLNNNGILTKDVSWAPSTSFATTSVAWGDVNRDGYLDLAVGNNTAPTEIFINNTGQLTNTPITLGTSKITTKVAWGDVNGDGWLDLVVSNSDVPSEVYINDGTGNLQKDLTFWNPTDLYTLDLVLGDIDNDGDLDLVTAPFSQYNEIKVHLNNQNQNFSNNADYALNYGYESSALALGDVDGDDDLDLAVVGFANAAAKVFENSNGRLQKNAFWVSQQLDQLAKVRWADVNGDGYLDLVVADHGAFTTSEPVQNTIYLNQDGELNSIPSWTSENVSNSGSLAIGDVNNDGQMDVTFGNGRISQDVTGYNWPGQGWYSEYIETYQGTISSLPNNNMSIKIVETGAADFYGRSEVLTSRYITMPFKIVDEDGDKAIRIEADYSPNGGGKWYPAIHRDSTTNIISGSFLSDGTTYEYYWDTFASGFFGQSDNVVFRLNVYPSYQSGPNRIGDAYQFARYATQTFPFRVRGTQVQVFSGTTATPAADARVLRIPAGTNTAQLMANSIGGQPFETDEQGYLSGRGEIGLGDQLIALVPTTPPAWLPANKVEVYLTNGVASTQSLTGKTVAEPGVQQLVVSEDKRLVLFNLDVSLEWDARQDDVYMTSLEFHLRRASDLLFDWSNGQMALGHINLYHNREMWEQADIRILASNRYRPNATKGGLVTSITEDPALPAITYGPGQLRMGATWNRTGQAAADLSEDWARTLVHELGHYLLFMDDNYFGFDENGNFINIDSCTGVMANPYRDSDEDGYDEFHSDTNWLTNCAQTASNVGTGRSDWSTLATFYPLQKPANGIVAINGPNGNPFVVTFETKTTNASTTIEDQSFTLIGAAGGPYFAAASAQGFIARQGTHIINLGNATRDQLLTRGVQPNDRLCLQDLANGHFGCKDITADDNGELLINTNNSWRPDIAIRPVNSTTVQITIKTTNPASDLYAQIYPSDTAPEAELLLTAVSNTEFTGQFDLDNPTTSATVHVWGIDSASNKRFDTITDYELGGNPICFWVFTRGCNNGAPVLSADGRAVINGENLDFGEGEFYVLQTASTLPELPAWGIPVGQPYRLTKSAGAPAFDGLVLQLTYLQREVPPGAEEHLLIYYLNEADPTARWKQLETTRADNTAPAVSAPVQDQGLYIILATIATPSLNTGWNLFAYPDVNERPVTEALVSLDPQLFGCDQYCYTSVYQYKNQSWLLYDQTIPEPYAALVNTLPTLQPLNTYWIYATKPVNPLIKPRTADAQQNLELPPATYYGAVTASSGFDPQIGDVVEGRVNGVLCGTGQVTNSVIGLMYTVQIKADNGNGCGAAEREVVFSIDGQTMPHTAAWDNSAACFHPLDFSATAPTACEPPVSLTSVYLPAIVRR